MLVFWPTYAEIAASSFETTKRDPLITVRSHFSGVTPQKRAPTELRIPWHLPVIGPSVLAGEASAESNVRVEKVVGTSACSETD